MKGAKITQTEAKAQDGFLASLRLLISPITSENNTRKQDKHYFRLYTPLITRQDHIAKVKR